MIIGLCRLPLTESPAPSALLASRAATITSQTCWWEAQWGMALVAMYTTRTTERRLRIQAIKKSRAADREHGRSLLRNITGTHASTAPLSPGVFSLKSQTVEVLNKVLKTWVEPAKRGDSIKPGVER